MIKRFLYYLIWLLVLVVLVFYAINFKGGNDAMVAQVENEVMAISYQKPVLVSKIYISPGQVVDSGDLLFEVERPDLKLNFERKVKDKQQYENGIREANEIYKNALEILKTKYRGNKQVLLSEKADLQHQMQFIENSRLRMDSVSTLSFKTADSIRYQKILLIDEQLSNLDYKFGIEMQQLLILFQNDTTRYRAELNIINKEIDELIIEQLQLQKRAEKRCTIGNLFVQLNELVPPFKTLLTLYDINPTLIKAFVNERGVEDLRIGAKVIVESINKEYKIEGQIIEIGSRITAYPDKINPLFNQTSYGQEIFINIANENEFLNGEKVYVYIDED